MKKIAAIILAAGKGERMGSHKINKVVNLLNGKPMILITVEKLKELSIDPIVTVVGFAKKSVIDALKKNVIYAEQLKRLGTAYALSCGIKKLPKDAKTVIVVNGDDSAFYKKELIEKLFRTHFKTKAALSFLTINTQDSLGLGRVIRDSSGELLEIIEEKDATDKQRKIKEINPGCYVFEISFLKKYLNKIKKSPVSGEYYLTKLIDLAIKNKEKINDVRSGNIIWRGINTTEDLKKAQKLFLSIR